MERLGTSNGFDFGGTHKITALEMKPIRVGTGLGQA